MIDSTVFLEPVYAYAAKLDRVVDGDTCDVWIDLGCKSWIFRRLRFIDYDADEKRGGTDETKLRALVAEQQLSRLLREGELFLRTEWDAEGKYGRLLARLFVKRSDGFVVDVIASMKGANLSKGDTAEIDSGHRTFARTIEQVMIGETYHNRRTDNAGT